MSYSLSRLSCSFCWLAPTNLNFSTPFLQNLNVGIAEIPSASDVSLFSSTSTCKNKRVINFYNAKVIYLKILFEMNYVLNVLKLFLVSKDYNFQNFKFKNLLGNRNRIECSGIEIKLISLFIICTKDFYIEILVYTDLVWPCRI